MGKKTAAQIAKERYLRTKAKRQKDPKTAAIDSLWGTQGSLAGEALIDSLGMKGNFLGRVSEDIPGQNEYLEMLKAGLGGYTSPEYQAQREQMQQGLNSQYATAQQQLAKAQSRGRVYGAAGAAQQANLSRATQDSKNDLEQQLMVKNIDERQNRLTKYGSENSAAQKDVLERQKLNQGNTASEIAARTGVVTGTGGLAITNAQNAAMRRIQEEGLAAMNPTRPATPATPATPRTPAAPAGPNYVRTGKTVNGKPEWKNNATGGLIRSKGDPNQKSVTSKTNTQKVDSDKFKIPGY